MTPSPERNARLLDEARRFCDPATGEVVERIPEDLMKKLRNAKLARGIPGKPNPDTESQATWFVFFDAEIRARVLADVRRVRANQRRARAKRAKRNDASTKTAQSGGEVGPSGNRGLKAFLRRQNSSGRLDEN